MQPDGSIPQPRSALRRFFVPDIAAALLLLLLAIWLFRGHFFGDSLWIGNPDRLNSDLKVLRHYLSGVGGGHIPAWNEHEMMGYDSFVLPYTFPNPIVYFVALFGKDSLYVAMGYVVIAQLWAAGISAYAFLRSSMRVGLPVLVGAVCYEFSYLTVLKVSQNSMSFAVFIVIPLLLLAIRRTSRERSAWNFLLLAILIGSMLSMMFLQKAAYALILSGAYAGWRSWITRSGRPILVFCLAAGVAITFAFPRMLAIGQAMAEYQRAIVGIDLKSFDALYRFQNISPYEILRWLDSSIFGRSPSDSSAIKNNINLTEGFLLFTSGVVPFLLIAGLAIHRSTWMRPSRNSYHDEAFFLWMLMIGICVVVFKPLNHLFFLAFMRLDFTHARFQISALLPLAVLVAAILGYLSPRNPNDSSAVRYRMLGLFCGALVALVIDVVSVQFQHTISFTGFTDVPLQASNLRVDSLSRVSLSILALIALLWMTLRGAFRTQETAFAALCALIISQCMLSSNAQINGQQVHNFSRPFLKGDHYQAQREEFRVPNEMQLGTLHRSIEPHRYRVALLCDPLIADGFCAGHVPEFWRLRTIDGYYGLAVPSRLRAFPWPGNVGLRTISFTNTQSVPWGLLGLLNVRSVLIASDGVFRNITRNEQHVTGIPDPATFTILHSPERVTPRAFFASSTTPVDSPEAAIRALFRSEGIVDPVKESFVEGAEMSRTYATGGTIEVKGHHDSLELHFDASHEVRFLVLNELYFPGWHAEAKGEKLRVYATNAAMRGVAVPAGVSSVRFEYKSALQKASSTAARVFATLLFLGIFLALLNWERKQGISAT